MRATQEPENTEQGLGQQLERLRGEDAFAWRSRIRAGLRTHRSSMIVAVITVITISISGIADVFPISRSISYGSLDTAKVRFISRSLSRHGVKYKYQVFVPDNWSPRQRWPIILFLHGAGERGSDGFIQTQVGIGEALRKNRSRFPAIVVMPQCQNDRWWSMPDMEELALATLAAATKEFKGDPRRTYLTGISMGGYGTWDIAAKNPHKFAAIVPISGGITLPKRLLQTEPELIAAGPDNVAASYTNVAAKIGKTPVWIFHGRDDDVVPPQDSRKLFSALKKTGDEVRYTEYPGVGHSAWEKAYADQNLTTWLLSKSL